MLENYKIDGKGLANLNILITGGAGVIGSRLLEFLLLRDEGVNSIRVIDNLSSSSYENIAKHVNQKDVTFIKGDLGDRASMNNALKDVDIVIHLAANADVRYRPDLGTDTDLKNSTIGTYNLLEEMRVKDVKYLLFSSSSSIYGNANIFPTPETYGPVLTESLYAASKLASEGLISSFSSMFGFKSLIFRFANITSATFRSMGRNVIPDFIFKLKENPQRLEILGNGQQEKSYLFVDDCIKGMLRMSESIDKPTDIFNLGNTDSTNVNTVADIVIREMGLRNVILSYTGGKVGWKGDISKTVLSIDKALKKGWKPTLSSNEAVRASVQGIIGRYTA